MNEMKKIILAGLIFVSTIALCSSSASAAANIFFSSPVEPGIGENLEIVVTLDTGGVSINAVELVINYDSDLLSFNGYSEENSIIKLFIEPPRAEQRPADIVWGLPWKKKIYLSGIIPGGVAGVYDANKKDEPAGLSPIPLVRLFFSARDTGNAKFFFESSKILQNDGLGTPLPHEQTPFEIAVKADPNAKKDIYPEKNKKVQEKNVGNVGAETLMIIFLAFLILIIILRITKRNKI